MAEETRSSGQLGWLEASGLLHVLRVLGFAVQPTKLGVALVAIILTLLSGGILDLIWKSGGGVGETAVSSFIAATEAGQPYEEPTGEFGIFQVWRRHQQQCISEMLTSLIPGATTAVPTPIEAARVRSVSCPLSGFLGMGYGVWWLLTQHWVYFIVFAVDLLLIWSWGGGAICRIAALEFARGEKPSLQQAHHYAMKHLVGGFALAPCIPLIGMGIVMVMMIVGGMVLRVPVLGDLLAGTAFPLAILAGFLVAILLVGLLIGGSLLWPAVAAEAQDAYDAFSRAMSYAFSKPWKTVFYAFITLVYGGICWVFVNVFTLLALGIVRAIVSFGTSPFGWWQRGTEGNATSKMELLWPRCGHGAWYSWPAWDQLTWYEHYSGFVIGLCVLLVVALMWAFLATFYYCSSTVVYFLLRRDIDKTELTEVADDEDEAEPAVPPGPDAPPSGQEESGLTLPIAEGPVDTPAPSSPPAKETQEPAPEPENVPPPAEPGPTVDEAPPDGRRTSQPYQDDE
ncbi:MAG: hypothetical protein ACE5HE_08385 [Phycisphaerae bacterium]